MSFPQGPHVLCRKWEETIEAKYAGSKFARLSSDVIVTKCPDDEPDDDLPNDEDSGDKEEGSEVVRDNPVVPNMDLGSLLDDIVASDEPDDDLPTDEDSGVKKEKGSEVVRDNPVVSNIVQTLIRQRPPVKPGNFEITRPDVSHRVGIYA